MKQVKMSDRKILAIIPARGDSEGIPGKNIVDLCGKPLITYSINSALKSKHIDKVVVSSDNEEILSVAKKHNAKIIKRPKRLAKKSSSIDLAIKHALGILKKQGYLPELVVLLQPTSPLRAVKTLDRAITLFLKEFPKYDSLIPLYEVGGKIGKINKKQYISLNTPGKQRHELKSFYKECGTVFIFKPNVILSGKFYGEKIYPFVIESAREALDIDSYDDLQLAEFFLRKRKDEIA